MPPQANRLSRWLIAAAALLCAIAAGQSAAQQASQIVGTLQRHIVTRGETLLDIARFYDLGFVELRAANPGVDPWVPPEGLEVILPTAHLLPDTRRPGIVINLTEQRLYYVPKSGPVVTHPIGTGRGGWETPLGATRIVSKRRDPSWTPPASIRAERPSLPAVIPPGPDNPLGAFALDLGWRGYVIHGTNRPYGVGRRVSHGCIRLYPEDIALLFDRIRVGTPVKVISEPVKMGWAQGELFLEAHPTLAQADEIEASGHFTQMEHVPDLDRRIILAAGADVPRLDWDLVDQVLAERRGIPVRVTEPIAPLDSPETLAPDYFRSD